MSEATDERAAGQAAAAGEGIRTIVHAPLVAYEVASRRRVRPEPQLFFRSWAPICGDCHEEVRWLGGPEVIQRAGEAADVLYVYILACGCPEPDEILLPFPLCICGTAIWWREEMGGLPI